MSSNSGGRTKKRGRGATGLTLAGSPLVGRNVKRAGKSPGPTPSPKSAGPKGASLALAIDESDIVLDRLEKEIVALLRAGGSKKDAVRRRLRLGINEVTKFLEATATTTAAAASSSAKKLSSRSNPPAAIVLVCRDVRPPRLVEHLHTLVSLTSTPHLVLSAPSSSLGRIFGCKTMAALAICPPRSSSVQPSRPLPSTSSVPPDPFSSTTRNGSGGNGGAAGESESTNSQLPVGISSSSSSSSSSSNNSNPARSGKVDGGGVRVRDGSTCGAGDKTGLEKSEGGGQKGQRVPAVSVAGVGRETAEAVSTAAAAAAAAEDEDEKRAEQGRGAREGGDAVPVGEHGRDQEDEGAGRGVGGAGVASVDTAHVDESVDSLVEFLRRKVRVPQP